ncbi:plasmid replication protein, CyRepA1 family [Nodularia spumigena]|uniref:plasmid replication protein, CyRepA1 family n=1 Tax=Nodularia spumigena TaxID=70799 RepID=UPI002B1F5C84|nr:plasmid replication protein, CyRepA1 family [Nodularia spumigena]MEA5559071.1 plasmid replication protein, CyRepA1 family [Nodularia spumigena CH309]
MQFQITSQDNPCFCGNKKGDCRTTDTELIHCNTYADAKVGERIGDYVCVKASKGHTATFKLDNSQEWTEERRQEWREKQATRKELSARALEQKIASQLSAVDRDKYYRQILDKLSLSESDRTSLRSRGLSDAEIDDSLFRSVGKWQKVDGKFPANLPGVLRGDTLKTFKSGILCPIFNIDGLIIGLKVRKSEVDAGEGRYYWLTSKTKKNENGFTPHLDNELPLAVFGGIGDTAYITEGVEIKPRILNLRTNSIVLGGGRYWHLSPKQARKVVDYLKSKGIETIKICPDAGDILNEKGIPQKWIEEAEFFQSQGFEVVFEWHGQITKNHNDIDELDDYSQLNFISVDEFRALVKRHEKTDEQKEYDWMWCNWVKAGFYKASIKLDQASFSFPDIPTSNAIIAVKSGLGTGKTKAILREIARSSKHKGIRLIGYRNNLLFQTIGRGNTKEFQIKITHINEDGVADNDESIHMSCCINSLHKLTGLFEGHDIYIDETISVLKHTIEGGTFSGNDQAKAMKMLEEAVSKANRVFLLDGNLTDDAVDFIASLAPNKRVVKIENTRKAKPQKIYFCDAIERIDGDGDNATITIKKRHKAHLELMLLAEGTISFIATDSKKHAHALHKLLSDNGKKGFVISQDTVGEDWAKKFLKNPGSYIEAFRPDFVIITPSCESGISVEFENNFYHRFTHKFSFFCGVLGTSSQHQIMFRLRDDTIPHYVFCPESTQLRDTTIPRQYTIQKMKEALEDRQTISAGMVIEVANNSATAKKIKDKAFERAAQDDKWDAIAFKYWCLSNYEKQNLRKCLIHSLKDAGHDVFEIQMDVSEETESKMKEIKAELIDAEAEALYRAIPYDSVEEAKKLAKSEHNRETALRIKKTLMIKDRLPGIDEKLGYGKGFWENQLKDRNFVIVHQNFAELHNIPYVQKRHEADWYFKLTADSFFRAGMRGVRYTRLMILHELNILDLVNLDKEYCKESPEIISLIDAFRNSERLQIAAGVEKHHVRETESGKELIAFFKMVMGWIGIKFAKAKKKLHEPSGKRLAFYKIDVDHFNDPLRLAIIDTIKAKDSEYLASDKAKIDWNYDYSVDDLANELAERFKTATQYSDYLAAKAEWEAKKDNSDMLTELVVQENTKIDRIIQLAWEKLTPQEQRRIVNLQPIPQNYLDVLDSRVMSNNYSPEHYNALPAGTRWKLRLSEVIALGETTAKLVYQQVPSELLQDVRFSLTAETQQYYIDLFPQPQPEPEPQLQVAVEVKPQPQQSRFIREPDTFWKKMNQEDSSENEIIRKFRENPADILELGRLIYEGGQVLINRLTKLHKDGLIKSYELVEMRYMKHKFMQAHGG